MLKEMVQAQTCGLTVKGITEVEKMRFYDIEGGFGRNKKAMLVKDIAAIHNRQEMHINEVINNNIRRFKRGIDIINLLGNKEFEIVVDDLGLKSSNRQKYSYLLSERGYSKLLKILEDDTAWDQYEKLVDGYFNMRKTIKQNPKLISNTTKEKEIEAKYNNSLSRKANAILKIANNPNLSKEYVQVLQAKATEILTGEQLLPLPVLEEKTYSATEIGKVLNISSNKVGKLTNEYGLKTKSYGKWFHDKSRYGNKEVESFRYYESVIPVLKKLVSGGI